MSVSCIFRIQNSEFRTQLFFVGPTVPTATYNLALPASV